MPRFVFIAGTVEEEREGVLVMELVEVEGKELLGLDPRLSMPG